MADYVAEVPASDTLTRSGVEVWLDTHAVEFWKILDFRVESGSTVIDWEEPLNAEQFGEDAEAISALP
jgi:hypothetical protein